MTDPANNPWSDWISDDEMAGGSKNAGYSVNAPRSGYFTGSNRNSDKLENRILPASQTTTTKSTFDGPMPTPEELATFKLPERQAAPKFDMPEMEATPVFDAPEWDENKISKMAQQNAAPGIRNLRTAVQAATSRRSDNPNVQRMTLRDALAGYGQGLEEVMSGARQSASSEYATKYAYEYKEAGMNWEAAVQAVRDKFAGQMEGRKMEFQAELDAVNQVYAASVQAESQRVAAENQKIMTMFDAAMQKYLGGKTTTTTTENKYDTADKLINNGKQSGWHNTMWGPTGM